MKKYFILLSSILLIAGCSSKLVEPKPTTTPSPVQTSTPDATTGATSYDGVTSATVNLNGLEYSVSLTTDDVKKIISDKDSTAVITKIELDDEKNQMVYELDIYTNNNQYDVKIDANSGDILEWKLDD